MKNHRSLMMIALLAIMAITFACSSSSDSTDDDEDRSDGDTNEAALAAANAARETIAYSAMEFQNAVMIFLGCASSDFTEPLFARSFADAEGNEEYWTNCYEALFDAIDRTTAHGDVEAALEKLGAIEATATPPANGVFVILKGWDFYKAIQATKTDIRNRFLQIANLLSATSKTELYEEVYNNKLSEEMKTEASTEAEFYASVNAGTFDDAMPQIHNLAYTFVHDYRDKTIELKSRPIDLTFTHGMDLVEKGAKFNNSVNLTILSTPLRDYVTERIDFTETAKKWLETIQQTTGTLTAGKSLVDYVQEKMPQLQPDASTVDDAEQAQSIVNTLDGVTINSLMNTEDPAQVTTSLLELGYSQITVNIPDSERQSSSEDSLEGSLVVVTSDDLFAGARVTIGSADTDNSPILVPPGSYDMTVSVGGEVQNVGDIDTAAGQTTDVTLDDSGWNEVAADNDTTDGDTDLTDGDDDSSATACSGSCDIMTDYQYCQGMSICLCVSDTGSWQLFSCQSLCLQSGYAGAQSCGADEMGLDTCWCTDDTSDGDVTDGDATDGDTTDGDTDGDSDSSSEPVYVDPDTGLMWENPTFLQAYGRESSWDAAMTFCNDLVWGGFDDWRMPTISELRSLIINCPSTETSGACLVSDSCLNYFSCKTNECQGCPGGENIYIAPVLEFPASGNNSLWSSSEIDYSSRSGGEAWVVHFGQAMIWNQYKSNPNPVRCVRTP